MKDLELPRRIARFFSRPVLEDIVRRGSAEQVGYELAMLGVSTGKSQSSMADLFEAAFALLSRHYRCEYVYKAAIANRIVFGRHSPSSASLAIELGVAGSIADAVVFNGTSTAYEIKTEYDSHRRLSTQTADYLRAFDKVYVVTHPDLATRYAGLVDERVGILCLNSKNSFSEIRPAIADISRVEPAVVCNMLRQNELMHTVQRYFGPQPELPNTLIAQHYGELFCQLSQFQVHQAIVSSLRQRTTAPEFVDFISRVPASLRSLAFAMPLSRPQRQRLLNVLTAPLQLRQTEAPVCL
ncbi:sce7726 family protein [Chromobacterium haemolyticum]|uniref:Sce7726 family protein n=1 Tax=Chromobacterium haemolyticum TaxID=394935 RepID=A0ABS3GKH3_9NEIS|nr:sce7726 family protein [Chromobacterium haemolyticum]MBK0415887.1 sce7726 family protein [Chromobacterium haemolyticum]MBO0415114.1 sce7726 family protein [Chromobacterium haemolyticum]MBO0498375.1 sce7726 family protein [Chromobacterium haemolyticum]